MTARTGLARSADQAGQREDPAPRRLRGGWLALGRVLYLGLLLLCLVLFGLSLWHILDKGVASCEGPMNAEWIYCQEFRQAQAQLGLTPALYEGYFLGLRVVASLPLLGLSLVLVWRRSEELRVLLLAGLLALLAVAGPWYQPLWLWAEGWLRDYTAVPYLGGAADLLTFLLVGGGLLFFYLFPDGRFVPRWSRWPALAWLGLVFIAEFFSESALSYHTWPAIPSALLQLVFVLSGLGAMLYRYRLRADAVQRQQIKWVVAGVVLMSLNWLADFVVWELIPALTEVHPIGPGLPAVVWELAQDTVWYVSQIVLALCFGVAIFRRRLWDIDLIVNRTLVYGGLTVSVVGLYVLLVGGLGALFQAQGHLLISLLATGLIAVLFQPLRDRLQRGVNRLMFGERDDPVTLLSRLGHELETSATPEALLCNLVTAVAGALKLPYAAIELDGEVLAAAGEPQAGDRLRSEDLVRLPLVYQTQTVGHLLVGHRAPGEAFAPADRRLLETIAHQAGAAAHTVRLTAALQRSRQRIVAAREEERRRLRRDLHDGLGPQLASQTLGLDAVDRLIEPEPDRARGLIRELKKQAQEAVTDVRRLVYGLRPPALDDLGLRCALEEETRRFQEKGLGVTFEAPDPLPALPAAVEVAAYRIVQEALHNVARHAAARTCSVRLEVGSGQMGVGPDRLIIEVLDDGTGIPAGGRSGVGLQSMRERAAELNGRCLIGSRGSGGTRVWAELPLYEPPTSGETGVEPEAPPYPPLAEESDAHVIEYDPL
jgi:signal transduction histidine kinase